MFEYTIFHLLIINQSIINRIEKKLKINKINLITYNYLLIFKMLELLIFRLKF